ncbi:MAG: response regulator transcription factor [Roseivirga sp.]|nr:response regulator transcription factor [Roseivirga sp.]
MKVLIIEDEAPAFRRLQKILDEIKPEIEIIDVIDSVEDSVKWLKNHQAPDLIFMDIQLSDGISFEIFEYVKITNPVIFTTAFDEYMLRAFKVNSIDYLLKPIKTDDLASSLKKYEEMRSAFMEKDHTRDINTLIQHIRLDDKKYKNRFLVKKGDKLLSIESRDIAYFQTRNGVVSLVTLADRKHMVDYTLDELGQQLDPNDFFRANRQYLIHFSLIKEVHRYHKGKLLVEAKLKTDQPILISEEKSSLFKRWLDQ